MAATPVILSGDKDNPILTVWQYGLGRTVAWNSDVTGKWSGAFSGKDDYVQMWKRIVDYSTGNAGMGEDSVDVVTAGEWTEVTYYAKDYESSTEILVTIIDPKGDATEAKLHATAPGKYTGEFSTPQTGLYHFNVRRSENGEIQSYLPTAAAVQFSDEYKFDVSTDSYLNFVNQYGRRITEQDFIWNRISTKAKESFLLTNWLLLLSICLFVADVAMRRFQFVPKLPNKKSGRKKENTESVLSDMPGEKITGAEQEIKAKDSSEEDLKKKSKEVRAPKKTAKKTKASAQTLDTSQLLKKKDERNG